MVTGNDVLEIMDSWIGKSRSAGTHRDIIDLYNSHTPRARGYKVTYDDNYCDVTVSAVFIKLGAVALIGGTECSVQRHIDLFRKKGIWQEDGTITPRPADIICYNWDDGTQPNDGWADHIGFVYAVATDKKTMTIVEGNLKGKVGYRYNVPIGWGYIRGYAQPEYDSVTVPVSAGKDITTIAREVIAGKWGNGEERKKSLEAAGYEYEAVRKKVNEILKGEQTPAKTNEQIAKEVIAGKWGTGSDRKAALEAAGYSYAAIQTLVNQMAGKKTIYGVISTDKDPLRMREKASSTGRILQTIPKGTKIEILEKGKDWHKCKYNGKTGYCSAKYVKIS